MEEIIGGLIGTALGLAFLVWLVAWFVICIVLFPFLMWFAYKDVRKVRQILEIVFKEHIKVDEQNKIYEKSRNKLEKSNAVRGYRKWKQDEKDRKYNLMKDEIARRKGN